jgi:hypothetical protein
MKGPKPKSLEQRIRESSVIDPITGCWNWTKELSKPQGYARMVIGSRADQTRRDTYGHRVSYEVFRRKIPDGMVIDHVCRNRACVNPEHLRLVALGQNTLENSLSTSAINAQKTYCIRNHPLFGDNLYISPEGGRQCRTCTRMRSEIYRRERGILARIYKTRRQ